MRPGGVLFQPLHIAIESGHFGELNRKYMSYQQKPPIGRHLLHNGGLKCCLNKSLKILGFLRLEFIQFDQF